MLFLTRYYLIIASIAMAFTPGIAAAFNPVNADFEFYRGPHDCDSDTIIDDRDGYPNHYPTVRIGNQCWMAENLRYLPEVFPPTDGSSDIPKYYVYDNDGYSVDEARGLPDFLAYGVLYNWPAAIADENVCPVGWHLPSKAEWDMLIAFMQDEYDLHNDDIDDPYGVGNALKFCRQVGHPDDECNINDHPRWNAHLIHFGFDEVAFGALPAGYRANSQSNIFQRGISSRWWASNPSPHMYRIIRSQANVSNDSFSPFEGLSIRCIKSHYELGLSVDSDEHGTAEINNEELHPPPYRHGETVSIMARAYEGYVFDKWEGDTEFMDDEMAGTWSITFTMPPKNVSLVAMFEQIDPHQCGDDLFDNSDGQENTYTTVAIGDRCWIAENLRYLPEVHLPNDQSQEDPRFYVYGQMNDELSDAISSENYNNYGVLYNWSAANEACPVGWELPSEAHWNEMVDYLIGPDHEIHPDNIGNALKSCRQVNHPEESCDVAEHPRWDGSNQHGFDQVDFSALPGGYMFASDSLFWLKGAVAYFWQIRDDNSLGWRRMNASSPGLSNNAGNFNENDAFSVRCIQSIYAIDASPNNSEFGDIDGDGDNFVHFETVQLTATPYTGYHFVNWTEEGQEVHTESMYIFSATGNRTLVANLATNTYTITAWAGSNGSIEPAGVVTVSHFDNFLFHIEPEEGFYVEFIRVDNDPINLNEDPAWNADNQTYTFYEIDQSHTIEAGFASITFTITSSAGENGNIEPEGEIEADFGSNLSFAITPDEGYHIEIIQIDGNDDGLNHPQWTPEPITASGTYQFSNIQNDHEIHAEFAINVYTLTYTAVANGSIDGDTIQLVEHGSDGTPVEAIPDDGYHFTQWSDDLTDNPRTDTNITASMDILAFFAINTYTITATSNEPEYGSTLGTGIYEHFEEVTLTAVPNTGYHFDNWTENDEIVLDGDEPATATYVFIAEKERELVANFMVNTYTITATSNNSEHGTVSGSGSYAHFDTAVVEAFPLTGYHFEHWTEDGDFVSDSHQYEFEVEGPRDLLATFSINVYTVTYTAESNGTIEGDTIQLIEHGGDGETVLAVAEVGHHFTQWSDGLAESERTDTNITASMDLFAFFEVNTYTITAMSNDPEYGTTDGSGIYEHFAEATIKANPNIGHHFLEWTEDGNTVSTEMHYHFQVEGPRELIANFAVNTYEILAQPNNEDFGSVTGSGTYEHFEEVTLTAIPETGYFFLEWTEAGEVVMDGDDPASEVYIFTAEQDRELVAHFVIKTFTIEAIANDGGFIDPEGIHTIEYGKSKEFTIMPETGHDIDDVLVDGWSQGPMDTFVFYDVVQDHTIEAFFSPHIYIITATAGENGNIHPSGEIEVPYGGEKTFEIIADEGFTPSELLIDGSDMLFNGNAGWDPDEKTFTFLNVSQDHSIKVMFRIDRQKDVFIPKAFIPSDHGLPANRMFVPDFKPEYMMEIDDQTYMLQIHNRWGDKIFQTEGNPDLGWDGSKNGEIAPQGSYAYIITYERQGEKKVWRGVVLLLR